MSSHFLLVEDDDAHAELVTLALAESGCPTTLDRVADGEAALNYLHRRGTYTGARRPDTVLLDLRMPRLSGLEVLAAVKGDEILRSIPVIVLSTSTAPTDLANAYAHHANGYVVKPESYDEFCDVMKSLQSYWCGCNRLPSAG
jgi:CheY-like chemotaxis protein